MTTKDRYERDRSLARDYNSGMDCSALADKYALTVSTVRQYLVRLRKTGLVTRRPDRVYPAKQERNSLIMDAVRAGETVDDVGQRFDLSSAQVRNIIADAEAREKARLDTDPIIYIAVRLSAARSAASGAAGSDIALRAALADAILLHRERAS